jgi:hypothetical protein
MSTVVRDKALLGGAVALVAALAACGGGGHATTALPSTNGAPASASRGSAALTIKIPGTKKTMNALKRGVKYVPSATDTMLVAVSSGTTTLPVQTFSLAANSSLCVADSNGDGGRSCTVSVVAPITATGTATPPTPDTFEVTLEEAGTATAPISPPLLLARGSVNQTIIEGTANTTIALVLGGIPLTAYITVGPVSGGAFSETYANENSASPGIPINVHALDASYETIIGDYDTAPTSPSIYVSTPDYGNYVDSTGASATPHFFTSSNDQIYYVPSLDTGTYGGDLSSTGDVLQLEIDTPSMQSGTSTAYSWTFYTPSVIPSTLVSTPVATGPFSMSATSNSATYPTANGGIATFSSTDSSLYPTQQCGSYVDANNGVVAITPQSAVNVDTQGNFTGYALAANTIYALATPNPVGTPPPGAATPICMATAVSGNPGGLGNLRNLVYNSAAGELAFNSDKYPVVAIADITDGPTWKTIPYSTYAAAPPTSSLPDGLVSDPNSTYVYFTDSTAGIVGTANLSGQYVASEQTNLPAPISGLAVDVNGDVGFTANTRAFVFNNGYDVNANPIAMSLTTMGNTAAPVIGGGFSAAGSFEVDTYDNFQQYWTIDTSGALTSFGFVPDYGPTNVNFTYGTTSVTQIGSASAMIAFPNSALFIATPGGILQYPNQTIQQQNTLSIHRAPRAHARGPLGRRR